MPQIVNGTFTPSANTLDDVYVSILTPAATAVSGGASYNGGAPGFASWGPFNTPLASNTPSQLSAQFGPPLNTGSDLVREGSFFLKQGPLGGFLGSRVGNGTQTSASGSIGGVIAGTTNTALNLTATGTVGVGDVVTLTIGSTSLYSGATITATTTAATLANLITTLIAAVSANATVSAWLPASTVSGSTTSLNLATVDNSPIGTVTITSSNSATTFTGTHILQSLATSGSVGPLNPLAVAPISQQLNDAVGLAGFWEGTLGNSIIVGILKGSRSSTASPSWKVVVQCLSYATEIFDNIPQASTAAATWTNIVNAINNGLGSARPPSAWVYATINGSDTAYPTAGTYVQLSGGTDGVPANDAYSATLLGVDGVAGARTGIYAFESSNIDCLWLCGSTDTSLFSSLAAFADQQHLVAFGALPPDPTTQAATNYIAARLAANVDDPFFAITCGQHAFYDSTLQQNAFITQNAGFAGLCCSLDSSESPGNRPFIGLAGTDITLGNLQPFGVTDMGNLEGAGILFTALIPSGNVLGARHGRNSSSNTAIRELAYSRKVNDIARALAGPVLGQFINRKQSKQANDPVRAAVCVVLDDYFGPMVTAQTIDAYTRQCDTGNNQFPTISQGILNAAVQVELLSIINVFNCAVTAGQTVQVSVSTTATS